MNTTQATSHVKQPTGQCSVCGHYGEDCTGINPSTILELKPPQELVEGLHFTARDWMEIYYALESKEKSPTCEGKDADSIRWRKHLRAIMNKVGPDGIDAHLRGVQPKEPWEVHVSVNGGVANLEHAAKGIAVEIIDHDNEPDFPAATLYCDCPSHHNICEGTLYVPPSISTKGLPHIIAYAVRNGWHPAAMQHDVNGRYEYICDACHKASTKK